MGASLGQRLAVLGRLGQHRELDLAVVFSDHLGYLVEPDLKKLLALVDEIDAAIVKLLVKQTLDFRMDMSAVLGDLPRFLLEAACERVPLLGELSDRGLDIHDAAVALLHVSKRRHLALGLHSPLRGALILGPQDRDPSDRQQEDDKQCCSDGG